MRPVDFIAAQNSLLKYSYASRGIDDCTHPTSVCLLSDLTLIGVEGTEGDMFEDSTHDVVKTTLPKDFFDKPLYYIDQAKKERARKVTEHRTAHMRKSEEHDLKVLQQLLNKYPDIINTKDNSCK